MAQSPAERITVIERVVHLHTFQLDTSSKKVDAFDDSLREYEKKHCELERELALLKREVDELKKWKEDVKQSEQEWGRKLWMILPPVLAVFVSNAITLLITYYGKK